MLRANLPSAQRELQNISPKNCISLVRWKNTKEEITNQEETRIKGKLQRITTKGIQ